MPKETFFNLPDEKRRLILDLSIRAFADNDYQNVSISELVREAGIAKGSFYQYFEDKRDLYRYLMELVSREKAVFFARNPPPASQMDLFTYLRWMYSVGVRFEFRNPELARIGARAVSGASPLPEDARRVIGGSARQFFIELVAKAQNDGQLRRDLDPDLAAFLFNLIFTHLGEYILQRTGACGDETGTILRAFEGPDAERLFSQVVDILQMGMSISADR